MDKQCPSLSCINLGLGLLQAFLCFNYVLVRPSESPLQARKAGPLNSFFNALEDSFWLKRRKTSHEIHSISKNQSYIRTSGILYHVSLCIILCVQQKLHSRWLQIRVVMLRGCWASVTSKIQQAQIQVLYLSWLPYQVHSFKQNISRLALPYSSAYKWCN